MFLFWGMICEIRKTNGASTDALGPNGDDGEGEQRDTLRQDLRDGAAPGAGEGEEEGQRAAAKERSAAAKVLESAALAAEEVEAQVAKIEVAVAAAARKKATLLDMLSRVNGSWAAHVLSELSKVDGVVDAAVCLQRASRTQVWLQ